MIIESLLNLLYNLFRLLTVAINIPEMPVDVFDVIESVFSYIQAGIGILANYVNLDIVFIMLGIVIAVDIGVNLYHFVMWVIKKIPMLNIK